MRRLVDCKEILSSYLFFILRERSRILVSFLSFVFFIFYIDDIYYKLFSCNLNIIKVKTEKKLYTINML